MDKKEYQEKLNEIGRLIAVEDYNSAAQVADSIEWKRVRNVQTLLMISEIYEAVDRYQDSKILLLRAYRRSPLGRTVLYRLVECTVALKQFDEAIEYYSEYVQAAPRDNNKYILKYKIYRGRGSSLDEQIDILKEYLAQEKDSERWSYELAKLYREAGRTQECINTCDDLVLWYQSGKYVIKALELKKKIAPLTPRQQEIYDSRFDQQTDDDRDEESEASYLQQARAERATLQQDAIKSELAHDVSKAAARQAAMRNDSARENTAMAQTRQKPQMPSAQAAQQASQPAGQAVRETFAQQEEQPSEAAGQKASQPAAGAEMASSATEGTESRPEAVSDSKAEETEQARSQAAMTFTPEAPQTENAEAEENTEAEEAQTAPSAAQSQESAEVMAPEEEKPVDQGVHYDEKTLKQNLAESMKEIVSGVGPRDTVDEEEEQLDRVIEQSKEDQEAAVVSRGLGMTFGMQQKAERKPEAPRLTIDDILLSMDDKGDSVRRAVSDKTGSLPGGVVPAEEEAKANSMAAAHMNHEAEENIPSLAPAESGNTEAAAETDETPQAAVSTESAVETGETPQAAVSTESTVETGETPQAAVCTATETVNIESAAAAGEAQAESGSAGTETAAAAAGKAAPEDQSAFGLAEEKRQDASMEDILEAKTRVLPTEEISKLHEEFLRRESAVRDAGARMAEKIAAEAEAQERAQAAAAAGKEGSGAEAGAAEQDQMPQGQTAAGQDQIPEGQAGAAEQDQTDGSQTIPDQKQMAQGKEQMARQEAAGEQVMRELQPEASVEEPQYKAKKTYLKPYQRDLFRGFLDIGNLEEQIARAIDQAEMKGQDRTSRTGNVLILGGHGCGKTTIATGIAKAVAEDMGTHTVKMARIYAADLNRKDIAATIAKIAGGVLIVEEAGDLEDSIVDQLTTAMEFRTDGMIMILEDEQRYIHDLLMRHPRFTMKFTAQIYIPPFSSKDLVNFGELYAESRDCSFSDDAKAALTGRLEAAAKAGEAVSITNVVELANRAIKNSGKFFRRMQSAKKRYDDQNRVILRAKDFR